MSQALLLLFLLIVRPAKAQQCGEEWERFVVNGNGGGALLEVNKANGCEAVLFICIVCVQQLPHLVAKTTAKPVCSRWRSAT